MDGIGGILTLLLALSVAVNIYLYQQVQELNRQVRLLSRRRLVRLVAHLYTTNGDAEMDHLVFGQQGRIKVTGTWTPSGNEAEIPAAELMLDVTPLVAVDPATGIVTAGNEEGVALVQVTHVDSGLSCSLQIPIVAAPPPPPPPDVLGSIRAELVEVD
jgi:hypothetical protein